MPRSADHGMDSVGPLFALSGLRLSLGGAEEPKTRIALSRPSPVLSSHTQLGLAKPHGSKKAKKCMFGPRQRSHSLPWRAVFRYGLTPIRRQVTGTGTLCSHKAVSWRPHDLQGLHAEQKARPIWMVGATLRLESISAKTPTYEQTDCFGTKRLSDSDR